ncbi:MAG: hypothetical protein GY808_14915, partial [Gammaproteobacteria bacterium]|nr:hypothetical protein [Gammaproteobacteria bacterium]
KGKAITVASHFYLDGDTSHISKTIIDGSKPSNPDSGSVVYFISGEDTTSMLMGFTITGGSGTYTAEHSVRWGGGIACWFSGARLTSNRIINNTVNGNSHSVFGGGVGAGFLGSNAYVILEDNYVLNNQVNSTDDGAFGGGVGLACNGKLVDNVISYNSCTSKAYEANGGGVKITAESELLPRTVIVKGNRITHNFAEGKKFLGPHGAKGAGIVNHFCKVIILNNDILYNHLNAIEGGDAYGAGINMNRANSGSLISGNKISYNTIAENITSGGGGISLRYCGLSVSVTNNIISGNSATQGGGIMVLNFNSEIVNNTIVNNTASTTGGGLHSDGSNPKIINTILWDNDAPINSQINGNAIVRYSDIQGGYSGTGNINADPLFV